MRYITLTFLFVGLHNLLTKRAAALQASASGAALFKLLTPKHDAMAKLPAIVAGRALVDDLATTDRHHDALGYAIWHFLEAYLLHPDTPPALLAAVKKLRAAFLPSLGDLVIAYPAEAKNAMDRRPQLTTLKAELEMFPVAAGGATLLDWTTGMLDTADKIDGLLESRAETEKQGRKDASRLRGEVIGLLNRGRANMQHEIKDDPALPRDLDAQVFAYLDMLEQTCADAAAKGKTVEEAPPAPEEPAAPVE